MALIQFVEGWKGGDALVILADEAAVQWMIASFGWLSKPGVESDRFVIGDSNPIFSGGRGH
jgi:hypothetical protein